MNKKSFLLIIILCFASTTYAMEQNNHNHNEHPFSEKNYYWGLAAANLGTIVYKNMTKNNFTADEAFIGASLTILSTIYLNLGARNRINLRSIAGQIVTAFITPIGTICYIFSNTNE
jgi:hypothetical protein